MNQNYFMLLPVVLPVIFGLLLLIGKEPKNRNTLLTFTAVALVVSAAVTMTALFQENRELTLFWLIESLPIFFRVDTLGSIFAAVIAVVWVLCGVFAFIYMEHEHKNKRYFGFYLIVYGILNALSFAGNLITFYLFYEMMTLLSAPLVFHSQTHESLMAGLKYLFYSFAGAYMVLFGFYFVQHYGQTLTFTAGGVFSAETLAANGGLLLVAAMMMILGFSVKAGMFPLHGWLPTAHPVAPAPASAVLSGIIVKAGVLGIIRTVYYIFGAQFIAGTWVQTVWMVLSLVTVFMGSMLAYWEKGLKKRLAYSTVSQVSYILFGLSLCNPTAFTGSLLHVICHAFVKSALFLCAGAIIYKTGKTRVDELAGMGKQMPITLWCYTIVSLALIGIPPTGGFISKWYLATGSLESGIAVFSWLGPVILLVSALLTAGYLLPITINGFLPGKDYPLPKKAEPSWLMWLPVLILTLLALGMGLLPNSVIGTISQITAAIF